MDPKGKVALITGGARVGASVAEELARRGCHVALVYRGSRQAAEGTAKRARALRVKAMTIQADLGLEAEAARVVGAVHEELGGPDILVSMASIYRKTPLRALDEAALRANLDVDLGSAYRLALAAAPMMRTRGDGRIVAIADWLAASGRPRYRGFLPYYVAKTGVIGLVEGLALELAPDILVNAIAPGPILKPPGFSAAAEKAVKKATPLGRWGGPFEIARAALFLIDTEFVTGECIRVDGGRHLY